MKLPRLSTFPLQKPFERVELTTPLSEVALRLVVNCYTDAAFVIGTATVICGNLLLTAKHVLDEVWDKPPAEASPTVVNKHLAAIQLLPGPEYIIWDVVDGVAGPIADIALLRLGTNPRKSNPEKPHVWRQPQLNPFAPDIGERLVAFGYRNSTIQVSKNLQGGPHIELNDEPITSVGIVREIYEMRRDQLLPFPCYQVSARFDRGMSGGPVYDETGCLCGLVCSNVDGSHLDGEPVSYVTTLWPMFRSIISMDRGDAYPRGIRYPAIELARGGQIFVPDLPRLERWIAERIGPPPASSKGTTP